MTTLFTAESTNTSSVEFYAANGGTLAISGAFDSCTVTLQCKVGTSWVAVTDGAFTAEAVKVIDADNGRVPFRLTISNAGGSTSIDAEITTG